MWISKSRLLGAQGDLSATLDETIRRLRRGPASAPVPAVVGCFSPGGGCGGGADADPGLDAACCAAIRLSTLRPSTVHFNVRSTFATAVRATFSFYVRVGAADGMDAGGARDAEMLLPAGNWKSCSVWVGAHASSVCPLSFLPVHAGACSIVPRLDSIQRVAGAAEEGAAEPAEPADDRSAAHGDGWCPAPLLLPARLEIV